METAPLWEEEDAGIDLDRLAEFIRNPWDKVYWYARMFISGDYGRPGASRGMVHDIAGALETVLAAVEGREDALAIETLSAALRSVLMQRYRHWTGERPRQAEKLDRLVQDLSVMMTTRADFEALALTCRYVLPAILVSLARVPSDDRRFAE